MVDRESEISRAGELYITRDVKREPNATNSLQRMTRKHGLFLKIMEECMARYCCFPGGKGVLLTTVEKQKRILRKFSNRCEGGGDKTMLTYCPQRCSPWIWYSCRRDRRRVSPHFHKCSSCLDSLWFRSPHVSQACCSRSHCWPKFQCVPLPVWPLHWNLLCCSGFGGTRQRGGTSRRHVPRMWNGTFRPRWANEGTRLVGRWPETLSGRQLSWPGKSWWTAYSSTSAVWFPGHQILTALRLRCKSLRLSRNSSRSWMCSVEIIKSHFEISAPLPTPPPPPKKKKKT